MFVMANADREKWDARHAGTEPGSRTAPRWLDEVEPELPREGRALDVACGTGRIAIWAHHRGLEVSAIDISPVALEKVRAAAPGIVTVERDLESDPRLPRGPFTLVTCFHYRQSSLWPAMKTVLAPGGLIVAELLTVTNLERHEHPSRRWLCDPGELESWARGLELVRSEEGWFEGRHSARIVAKKVRR